ncbi:hypothetical protein [Mangrovicoccus sp. HB161399]|uniref:hypothetical protein n=1 Tax=Mangrovicoccus sp. HB161399 TaxID=2720392 RepID=UPI001558039D|nr:hypothetical protein [Mangrovicoccus sp. HB161399]
MTNDNPRILKQLQMSSSEVRVDSSDLVRHGENANGEWWVFACGTGAFQRSLWANVDPIRLDGELTVSDMHIVSPKSISIVSNVTFGRADWVLEVTHEN